MTKESCERGELDRVPEMPMRKLNIGLFSDTYLPDVNGVAVSVDTLRRQLEAMGHRVYVVTSSLETRLVGSAVMDGNVLRVPSVRMKQLYGYGLSRPMSLHGMEYIREMRLDLIHIHTEFSIRILAVTAAKLFRIPVVCTYHTMYEDYTHYVTRGYFKHSSKRLVAWYTRQILSSRQTRVVVPSEKTKQALERYGIKKQISVIPTGIDIERFLPDKLDWGEVKQTLERLKIPPDAFRLCYVGRLADEKSLDLILRAFPRLLQLVPNVVLLVTGYGPCEEAWKRLSDSLGLKDHVFFLGKCSPDQVQNAYGLGEVFVSASTSETQGITYVEAMGAGLPVIARYDECLQGLLTDGENGFFFRDVTEFVQKVTAYAALSQDQKQQMSQAALEKAKEYSLETFGKRILQVYEDAIAAVNVARR